MPIKDLSMKGLDNFCKTKDPEHFELHQELEILNNVLKKPLGSSVHEDKCIVRGRGVKSKFNFEIMRIPSQANFGKNLISPLSSPWK